MTEERNSIQTRLSVATSALLCLVLTSCLMGKDDGAIVPVINSAGLMGAGGLAGFQQTVYAYARLNCIECHASVDPPLFAQSDVNAAYSVALNYVNFSNIPFSLFVTKASDGHCHGPACTGAASATTMIQLITQWKAAYTNSGSGGTPGGTTVLMGNVFTNALTIPTPNPNCQAEGLLPSGALASGQQSAACTIDGLNTVTDPPTSCPNTCWTKLRYPVPLMSPQPPNSIARAWFEVDFAYDNYTTASGPASYVIANPRIITLDSAIYVHDLRIFINGVYQPLYGQEYQNADLVVTPWAVLTPLVSPTPFPSSCNMANASTAATAPAANWISGTNSSTYSANIEACFIPSVPNIYSTAIKASGILQVNDPNKGPADQISFSFDYLQAGISQPCSATVQQLWLANVYTPIKLGALQCLNCHKSGGSVTEAGQRFNMDDTDPVNCPSKPTADTGGNCYVTGCTCTQAKTQATICQKFLQRTNLANPSQSAIIVQPTQGLNGMPQQLGFSYYSSDWISWINSVAATQSTSQ